MQTEELDPSPYMLLAAPVFSGVHGLSILFSFVPLLLFCLFSSGCCDGGENVSRFVWPVAV